MKIIIVGAGIGGLITALRLHQEGIDCTIYEQTKWIRELGVGINLLPHAVKQLARLDLLDRLHQTGIHTHELIYSHRLGQKIMDRPCGIAAGFTLPQFSIHRGHLQGLLHRAVIERLGSDAVRTGHRLTSFNQATNAVHVHFAGPGGTVIAEGDVLVGADGIHSTVRATLFPQEGTPRWNGVTMWRGATDWPEFGTGRTMLIAGGQTKLVIYPIAEGQTPGTKLTNWVLCAPTGQAGDPPPDRQDWAQLADPVELKPHLDTFTIPLLDHTALINATREAFVFPMCDRDPLPLWSHRRVTLLGDAAHPMYPMGSNGAGQAILDATNLADHLAWHDDPTEALRAYQNDRLPVTTELVHRNRLGGPEGVIDIVEQRAPNGFTLLDDIIGPAELETIVTSYAQAAGSQSQVNSTSCESTR